jgi:hypothetical protein
MSEPKEYQKKTDLEESSERENSANSETSESETLRRMEGQSYRNPNKEENDEAHIEAQAGQSHAETNDTSKKRNPFFKIAQATAVVLALLVGFVVFNTTSSRNSVKIAKSDSDKPFQASNEAKQTETVTSQQINSTRIYHEKLKEVDLLRESLLQKKEEIKRLKKHYEEGISELERQISDQIRNKEINGFHQALENKQIELNLQTIQRRQAYIRMLDRPSRWIDQGSEELLYLKRRTLLDLKVLEIASGIDMDVHMRHLNAAIQNYRPTADKLAVTMENTRQEALEAIWKRIQTKRLRVSSQQANSKNQVIGNEICAGNYSRLAELSEISIEVATCLSKMQGTDLFLNAIPEISPSAAKHLIQWKGHWMCLNGFKVLSPNVANYLFQWDGDWISLNGLTEFPPELGKQLLKWKGSRLELMGLRYNGKNPESIALAYLARWEKLGGNLFVSEIIRKRLDE